jgi:hypothetical protein
MTIGLMSLGKSFHPDGPAQDCDGGAWPNDDVALDRAGITVFRDITFLVVGPASESDRFAVLATQPRRTIEAP